MTPDSHSGSTGAAAEASRFASRVSWRIAAIGFLGGIGGGIVFPILPVLGDKLGLSGAMIGLILALNRIVRIGVNPFTGSIVDRFGGKAPLTAGLVTEAVATLGYSVALGSTDPTAWFLASRALWGVGSSFLIVGALAAILALTREDDRGRLTARVRMAMSLGLPAGLSLGGLVADFVSDDAAFLLAAGLSFCAALLAFMTVPGRTQHTPAPHRDASAWDDWKMLLAKPALRFVWSYYFLVFLSIQGILLATLVIFITRRGLILPGLGGQGSAGILMGFLMLWRAAAAIAIGRWLDRTHHRRTALLPAAIGLLLLGFILLAIAHNLWWTCVGLMCLGVGTGAVTIPLLTLLGDVTSADRRGRALAIYQVFGDIGGSLGPIVGLEAGMDFGFLATYLGLAAIFAASVPFTLLSKRYERGGR